jgi:hypothetical protein
VGSIPIARSSFRSQKAAFEGGFLIYSSARFASRLLQAPLNPRIRVLFR